SSCTIVKKLIDPPSCRRLRTRDKRALTTYRHTRGRLSMIRCPTRTRERRRRRRPCMGKPSKKPGRTLQAKLIELLEAHPDVDPERLAEALDGVTRKASILLRDELKTRMPEMLDDHRRVHAGFHGRL